jgi:hypothetical protein
MTVFIKLSVITSVAKDNFGNANLQNTNYNPCVARVLENSKFEEHKLSLSF